jgi:hypothetical protein
MRELVSHLYPLQRDGLISSWYDGQILPGEEWAPQIKQNLEQAQIILLLISKDFLNSDYCYEIELTKAIERHRAGTASVIPVILRSCLWDQVSIGGFRLSDLQALPKDAKPISRWDDPDDTFTDVAKGLLDRIQQLQWKQDQVHQQTEQQRKASLELQQHLKVETKQIKQAAAEAKRIKQESEATKRHQGNNKIGEQESSSKLKSVQQQRPSQSERGEISRRKFMNSLIPQSFLTWFGGAVLLTFIVQGLISIFDPDFMRKDSSSVTSTNEDSVYSKLEELLRAKQWKAADQETLNVMLKSADRAEEGWLDSESILNFPCDVLEKIDQLWVEASSGKFGFKVQKTIYVEDCGGTIDGEYAATAWYCFADQVGWRVNGEWLSRAEVTFDIKAPVGHLPSWLTDKTSPAHTGTSVS